MDHEDRGPAAFIARSKISSRGKTIISRSVVAGLFASTSFCNQTQGRLADEYFCVEPPAPRQRRNIAILMHRLYVIFWSIPRMEVLAQGCANVWIGAMIQKQLREGRRLRSVLIIHPEVWL